MQVVGVLWRVRGCLERRGSDEDGIVTSHFASGGVLWRGRCHHKGCGCDEDGNVTFNFVLWRGGVVKIKKKKKNQNYFIYPRGEIQLVCLLLN